MRILKFKCKKHNFAWSPEIYFFGCPNCIAKKINEENKKLIQARNKMKGGKK